jgi:hypothetical protein
MDVESDICEDVRFRWALSELILLLTMAGMIDLQKRPKKSGITADPNVKLVHWFNHSKDLTALTGILT